MEYKISLATYTGRHHRAVGLPCQDKVALHRQEGAFCAALADGAGSRENSHIGAACVTDCVSRLLGTRFEDFWAMEPRELADTLTRDCLQALEDLEPPIYELASTLLFFSAHEDGRYLSGHLGDGAQILVEADGSRVFSPPENGAYQNETFFITAEDAVEHLRLRKGTLTQEGCLLLMSDGMAESLYQHSTGTPAGACRTIAAWLREGEEDIISQALEQNMERIFSSHSGDDLSLIVINFN